MIVVNSERIGQLLSRQPNANLCLLILLHFRLLPIVFSLGWCTSDSIKKEMSKEMHLKVNVVLRGVLF